MKKALIPVIMLFLGIGLIYTPCIPEMISPHKSKFDNIGTIYTPNETITAKEEEIVPVSSNIDVQSIDDFLTLESEESYFVPQTENVFYNNAETVSEVWLPKSGKKYHSKPDCSGMKNPTSSSLDEASSKGFSPCKKCFKST